MRLYSCLRLVLIRTVEQFVVRVKSLKIKANVFSQSVFQSTFFWVFFIFVLFMYMLFWYFMRELPEFSSVSVSFCSGYKVADEKLCTCCSLYLLFRRVSEGVRGLARCHIEVNYDVWGSRVSVAPISTAQSPCVTQPDTAELALYSQSACGC